MSSSVESDDREDSPAVGTPEDPALSILTNGKPIRCWARLIDGLGLSDVKLRIDDDGLRVQAVDPANVGMILLDAHAEGFERFDADETMTFGLNVDRFQSAVQFARMPGGDGDPVRIDVQTDPDRMRVAVTRPDQGLQRVSEWFGADLNMIREEPDDPGLDLDCRADPDPRAFADAVDAIETNHNHSWVSRDDETLILGTSSSGDTTPVEDDPDPGEDVVYFPDCAWSENGSDEPRSALYSLGYLKDMAKALKRSKADRVTLAWDESFPMMLHFEHEEWGFNGRYMLAPRIAPDDDEDGP